MYWPAFGGLLAHFVGANGVSPHTAELLAKGQ